jgi:ElaB/YqjD/DUF883 family membrane-anchored ribosome-binding protein
MKEDDFKQKTHELLDELKEFIKNLELKADEIADDAKEVYYDQLNNLKGIRDNLASKLEKYEGFSGSKWSVVKESADNFFTEATESWKKNFSRVTEAFKKE